MGADTAKKESVGTDTTKAESMETNQDRYGERHDIRKWYSHGDAARERNVPRDGRRECFVLW